MQIDFVKVPYTTGPNMVRNTGPVFTSSPSQDIIQAEKSRVTQAHGRSMGTGSKNGTCCKKGRRIL
jgi:hypothetical protein